MPRTAIGLAYLNTQELQLLCHCCGQPYYPNKAWEDQLRAIVFGAEKYAICPLCTQEVAEDVFHDRAYRERCRSEVKRLQRLYEAAIRKREGPHRAE